MSLMQSVSFLEESKSSSDKVSQKILWKLLTISAVYLKYLLGSGCNSDLCIDPLFNLTFCLRKWC